VLHAALVFLVLAVVGAIMLYSGIAGDSVVLKLVFPVALVLYVITLVRGLARSERR